MMDGALLLPLLLIVVGVVLVLRARRRRAALGLPPGEPIYQDSQEQPGETLYSRRLRIKGRPDLLLRTHDAIIPVEVKTGRTPEHPYWNQQIQLAAYCVLVEEHYGARPPYGILRYPDAQFTVEFSAELERDLEAVVADMRRKRGAPTVHRNHNNPRVCAACDLRPHCDERLAIQEALPLDF